MTDRRDFLKQTTLAGAGLLIANGFLNNAYATGKLDDTASMALRFRQVHLDFHTSEMITEVAKDFDAEEFAATLKKAYVNSVTAFARDHHGYLY